MKDCRLCNFYEKLFSGRCKKEHKLEFENRCKRCGIPYMYDAYWNNNIEECLDYKEKIYNKDPYG